MGTPVFDCIRFSEILASSPQSAFEYRLQHIGEPIPDTYGNITLDTSLNATLANKNIESSDEKVEVNEEKSEGNEEKTEYTLDDLRKLLKDAEIKYSNASNISTLMEKCIENNLI